MAAVTICSDCITFYIFLFKSIYLCIWLHLVLVAANGIFILHCGMWDLVPWSGIKPRSPALEAWRLSHWITRESVSESHSVMSDSLQLHVYSPWNSLGQNTGVGSLSLLQGIFPTQESNWGLVHCRQTLYQLSHKGSPRILEWVAYPFSSGSS